MAVEIPQALPTLPSAAEWYIAGLAHGGTFQELCNYANCLEGYWFRRCTSVVVHPFNRAKGQSTQTTHSAVIPLRTDCLTTHILLALGVYALRAGGYVEAEVREEPAEIGGLATPGSGALIDPGCRWRQQNADLPQPIDRGVYVPQGLAWASTGALRPLAVAPTDPMQDNPRCLQVLPATAQELIIRWDGCGLGALAWWELFKPSVG